MHGPFARRTQWEAAADPFAAAVSAARRAGRRLLDLTETNPTRCGFRYSAAGWEADLSCPAARAYEPDPFGMPAAREAVARCYADRGVAADPVRILLTAGTSEAYGHLMRLLCDPGDALLVPSPSYPLLDWLARLHDVRLVPYPLHYDGRWWLDVEGLRESLDPSSRAVVVISPNNPTGSYLSSEEREALVEIAGERGLAIIADEVFGDYALRPDLHRAGTMAGEHRVLTFTLDGASKTIGLPQMKIAWTLANGPPDALEDACRRLELIADTYLSVGTPVQAALPAWLPRRGGVQREILDRLRANLVTASRLRTAQCLPVEGGWCAVLRIPRTRGDSEFALELLNRDGVVVDPGNLFGFASDGHAVISLLPPCEVFAEGLARIEARA